MDTGPTSLQEAIVYFADPENCRDCVVRRRWPNGVICPTCGCKDVIFLANQNRWQCRNKHSKRQFSLKTGTIYEDSPLGLDRWFSRKMHSLLDFVISSSGGRQSQWSNCFV